MLLPYLDQLDSERQKTFKALAAFNPPFVLAGGTAIMLQVGYRKSYDFDCFCKDELLQDSLLRKIRRIVGASMQIRTNTPEVITVFSHDRIEITFAGHPYPPIRKIVATGGLPLFHLDDLAANKAFTLGRRPAWRDYVDLFFFMKSRMYPLETIIALAEKKFGGEFNAKIFVQQLTYFDDVPIIDTVFLKESYTPEEIKAFLGAQVRAYLATVLPE